MRLDEWQKYIDSQFLEDEQEPAPVPPPAPTAPADKQNDKTIVAPINPPASNSEMVLTADSPIASPENLKEAVPTPETAPTLIQNVVTMVVSSSPPPFLPQPAKPPRIELLTPLPSQVPEHPPAPEVTNRTRRRSQASESSFPPDVLDADGSAYPAADNPRAGLFEPLSGLDADMPEFERYMPGSGTLPLYQIDDSNIVAQETTSAKTDAACSSSSVSSPSVSPRRVPKSRARHARNVKPGPVPSGLSASELWATVPRHVQTLLSLERLEEEIEVAQSSYKRPFQEKRHELIERLLDPILSLEDTARLLNVCPTTVRRYTNKGILTYYRKEPERAARLETSTGYENEKETRQRRFRLSDILAFLETQQTAVEADRQAEKRQARGVASTQKARREEKIFSGNNMEETTRQAQDSVTFHPSRDV